MLAIQNCPDVIITDWVMPGINGLELCRRIRQLHESRVLKHYSFIFLMTAQTGRQNLLEGLNAGADGFIEKGNDNFVNLKVEILVRLKTALRVRAMQRELEYSAKYDFLTDLLNRSTFFEQGRDIWAKSINQERPLSAVMIDCDYFKRINDTYGHQVGDSVLKSLAAILQEHSRGYDMICRYGGEEFCVLLPGCDETIAVSWAERIRKSFETEPILHGGEKINITASFGVAQRSDDMDALARLIEYADQALLFAKEAGRNRTVKYSDVLSDRFTSSSGQCSLQLLFDGMTAEDVMIPLVMTVNIKESVATVADFFAKTRAETLPVVDNQGNFLGLISEKNLLAVVGDKERWQDGIEEFVTKAIVVYPPETPLKTIYNFLLRVSRRWVLIVKEENPVGYIASNLLLRWLRNRWAFINSQMENSVPPPDKSLQTPETIQRQVDYLIQQLHEICETFISYREELSQEKTPCHINPIAEIVSHASKAQEAIEQILITNAGFANRQLVDEEHLAAMSGKPGDLTRYGLFD
jgi:diguanylate cyclase (GGDEF)-like protein